MPTHAESLRLLAALQHAADAPRRQALAAAYQSYFLRMIGLLRKRLPPHLCQRAGPDDLAQSAWGSFLRGLEEERFDLEGRDSLWPLLARVAIFKLHALIDCAHAGKRDVSRETPLNAVGPGGTGCCDRPPPRRQRYRRPQAGRANGTDFGHGGSSCRCRVACRPSIRRL